MFILIDTLLRMMAAQKRTASTADAAGPAKKKPGRRLHKRRICLLLLQVEEKTFVTLQSLAVSKRNIFDIAI